jgi:uncharacterized membrane protein YeaQ/YmgE (transglycosylase-associated protein family)
MSVIAWITLGLVAGLIANVLIPGRSQRGLILTYVIGIVGALLGGWMATKLFHIHSLQGFFNLSTWLTAIAGAAILLLAYHLISSQSSSRRPVRTPLTAAEGLRLSGWPRRRTAPGEDGDPAASPQRVLTAQRDSERS